MQTGKNGRATPEVKENDEFARWFREWTAGVQRRRASIKDMPTDKAARVEKRAARSPKPATSRVAHT